MLHHFFNLLLLERLLHLVFSRLVVNILSLHCEIFEFIVETKIGLFVV
jgi:hypothetical protein